VEKLVMKMSLYGCRHRVIVAEFADQKLHTTIVRGDDGE